MACDFLNFIDMSGTGYGNEFIGNACKAHINQMTVSVKLEPFFK